MDTISTCVGTVDRWGERRKCSAVYRGDRARMGEVGWVMLYRLSGTTGYCPVCRLELQEHEDRRQVWRDSRDFGPQRMEQGPDA